MATNTIVFKVAQFVMCLLILGMTLQINEYYKLDVIYITLGVFLGYLWVVSLLLLACLMNHEFDKSIEALPLGFAFIFFIATSTVLLYMNADLKKSERRSGFAGGIISIAIAMIFLVDCVLTVISSQSK